MWGYIQKDFLSSQICGSKGWKIQVLDYRVGILEMVVEWKRGKAKGVMYLNVSVRIWEDTQKGRQPRIYFLDFNSNGAIKI